MRAAKFALALTLVCTTSGILHAQQYGPPQGPPPPGYGDRDNDRSNDRGCGDRGGWETPPCEFRESQREGFQDGIVDARKDAENNRRPNVNNRDEYRRPDVPGNVRRGYHGAFRRGYNTAMTNLQSPGRC